MIHPDSVRMWEAETASFRERIREQVAEIERLRAALSTIESLCTDEIRARFGSHHSKTEEELAGKSKVYGLLAIPRNIARNVLANCGKSVESSGASENV